MGSEAVEYSLRDSFRRIGGLYPVLLDRHGNVIDGNHRLAIDANWPKVKLGHIESEEQRLIARLSSNVCRRKVSAKEKSKMLRELGDIYVRRGIGFDRLARKISEETGMSYRWVMEYLPDNYKLRSGLGGPKPMFGLYKSKDEVYKCKVARHATLLIAIFPIGTENILSVKNYSNTNFVHIIMERRYYAKVEGIAKNLNIDPEALINGVFLSVLKAYGTHSAEERPAEATA